MSPEARQQQPQDDNFEFIPPSIDERTPEAFLAIWGEKCGLTPKQFGQMWDISAKNIGDDHEYHNANHPRESLWVSMKWVDLFESIGITVNRKVVIGAVMYHDDGYHDDHTDLGYKTKEEFSAARFEADAGLYEYSDEEIILGKNAILATTRGTVPKTAESLAVVLGDLWNLGADFNLHFLPKTLDIAKETSSKMQSIGNNFSYSDFMTQSIGILADYTWALESQTVCKLDIFLNPAVNNLRRLLGKAATNDSLIVGSYLESLNENAKNHLIQLLAGHPDS